mmetsp:Transcript_2467/g.9295  ORF Transcript_2467/g.9295 Transcript_2467/m.9295 type:complete len:143 (+) Transcript_2467:2628-3056(+)
MMRLIKIFVHFFCLSKTKTQLVLLFILPWHTFSSTLGQFLSVVCIIIIIDSGISPQQQSAVHAQQNSEKSLLPFICVCDIFEVTFIFVEQEDEIAPCLRTLSRNPHSLKHLNIQNIFPLATCSISTNASNSSTRGNTSPNPI